MKRIYIALTVVLILIILPVALWFLASPKELKIAVIDKTVPDDSYREHQGLIWALKHLKYEKDNEEYDLTDYFGAAPKGEENETMKLPTDYSEYDAIYLADSYGVYEGDIATSEKRQGARSEKIVGGLEMEEWNQITKRLTSDEKSLFIAEYNSFASPTTPEVRQAMLDYLELDWEGWVGRYFTELDYEKNNEIPQWIVEQYQDQWAYEGGGFVLVNDFSNELIVLELDRHVSDAGIRLDYTQKGQVLFGKSPDTNYEYWFDIVTANNEENILANYQWNLTEEGEKLLTEKGIPLSFSAVIQNKRKNALNYYFAGDYNDVSKVPAFYQAKGLGALYKVGQIFSEDAFYWSIYVPMMKAILKDFENMKVEETREKASDFGYNARSNGEQFEVYQDGKWEPLTFKGVNMGMGKPGYFPGEAAITESEYYRWFQQIGEMNANTIRVYTLHPPGFYKALAKYNEQAETPIYILHGVWIEEESLEETLDAYEPETLKAFREEMETIVDVIHGNRYVEPRTGHASGLYDEDVSQYVIGWVIGIEWYPYMVQNTNKQHQTIGQYTGQYFETKDAAPFEYWLAEQMDFLTQYEQEKYQWIRPMSFTNWVTTDLLEHPSEPSEQEDLVSVDPNVIYTKGLASETGQFASYHVYPYYPDFLNYDENYLSYTDHRGEKNSYAGYLADLRAAHRMPVLIAEFGIPGSRGLTHDNPFGWLSFDRHKIRVDGDLSEWDGTPLYNETDEASIMLDHDERYLYVRISGELAKELSPRILLDVVPNQGKRSAGQMPGTTFSNGVEFIVELNRGGDSRILIDPYYDFFNYLYGHQLKLIDSMTVQEKKASNEFHPIYYALNKELTLPESGKTVPFTTYEAGKLVEGNGNPEAKDYNSLADYSWNDEGIIELRIPWLLIQSKDPSRKEFMGNVYQDGADASVFVDNISLGVLFVDDEGEVVQSLPSSDNGKLGKFDTYSWDNWEQPATEERLKKSYDIMQETFSRYE